MAHVFFTFEDEGHTFTGNIGNRLTSDAFAQPKRPKLSITSLWNPQNLNSSQGLVYGEEIYNFKLNAKSTGQRGYLGF